MQVLVGEQNLGDKPKVDKLNIVDEIQNLLKAAEIDVDNNTNSNDKVEDTKPMESCHTPKPIQSHTPFPGISQLLPTLYLCGAGVAMPQVLDQLEVGFIINIAPELPDTPLSSVTKPLYLRINAMDRSGVELSVHFDEVADMIEEVRQHGGKSLVHCVAGVSRSATICIAYLMKYAAMNLREAYLYVKAIRPQIRPNLGFIQQLRRYDEQLYGKSSVKMIFYESLNREIPDVLETEYKAMEEFYQRQRKMLKERQTITQRS